ncbi:MAG TPA: hypothetical protein VEG08_11070 [Terriglobales bacterium]|nr:hypothetical protein [Terriglobales bacterium]
MKNEELKSRRGRVWRRCALLGAGLVAVSVVMANFQPYDFGDMRIFTWAAVAGMVLLGGAVLLLVALLGWVVTRLRRRSSSAHP